MGNWNYMLPLFNVKNIAVFVMVISGKEETCFFIFLTQRIQIYYVQ